MECDTHATHELEAARALARDAAAHYAGDASAASIGAVCEQGCHNSLLGSNVKEGRKSRLQGLGTKPQVKDMRA